MKTKYMASIFAILVSASAVFAFTTLNIASFSGKGSATIAELSRYDAGSITANAVSSGVVAEDSDGNTKWERALITVKGTGTPVNPANPEKVYASVWMKSGADCDVSTTSVVCDGTGAVKYLNIATPQVNGDAHLEVDSTTIRLTVTDPVSGDVLADVEAPINKFKVLTTTV